MGDARLGDEHQSDQNGTPPPGTREGQAPDLRPDPEAKKPDAAHGIFVVRQAVPADSGFIVQNFIEGYYRGNKWLKEHCKKETFYPFYSDIIDRLFVRHGAGASVLVLTDDPATTIGFVVYNQSVAGTVLHWIYVKKDFRRFGLAGAMLRHVVPTPLSSSPVFYTHRVDWMKKKPPPVNFAFSPFLFS